MPTQIKQKTFADSYQVAITVTIFLLSMVRKKTTSHIPTILSLEVKDNHLQ